MTIDLFAINDKHRILKNGYPAKIGYVYQQVCHPWFPQLEDKLNKHLIFDFDQNGIKDSFLFRNGKLSILRVSEERCEALKEVYRKVLKQKLLSYKMLVETMTDAYLHLKHNTDN